MPGRKAARATAALLLVLGGAAAGCGPTHGPAGRPLPPSSAATDPSRPVGTDPAATPAPDAPAPAPSGAVSAPTAPVSRPAAPLRTTAPTGDPENPVDLQHRPTR